MTQYNLQGNVVVENPKGLPKVGNLLYDDLGKRIIDELNKEFEKAPRISLTNVEEGKPISYSNVPRALFIDQKLAELDPKMYGHIHLLSPEEVIRFLELGVIPEVSSTYADTNSIVVYPNEGPNENLRQEVMDIMGIRNPKIPFVVPRLGFEYAADNDQKFRFKRKKGLTQEPKEAEWLRQEGYVRYNPKTNSLESCAIEDKGARYVWTPNDQSGLRRLCRGGSGVLGARVDDLLSSSDDGRVQIFQDPKGLAKK
ncbi:MAG: hypothetical protein ABIH25_03415 [Candidatus Woesearchaeota archaeon]